MLSRYCCLCLIIVFYRVVTATAPCSTDAKKFRFDYKYYADADGWFKLHRVPANWHEARLRCDLEGGVLASPLNSNLLDTLKTVMWINEVQQHAVYTGVHATFSRGDFFSVEGVPLSKLHVNWAPNEPNNLEDAQSCLTFNANGTVADVRCTDVFPYICFKNDTNLVINRCGTIDDEYYLDPRTDSCYKFHRIAQPWSRAYMTCAAEGAYLSIINSEAESEVLKDLFAKNPDNTIKGTTFRGEAAIGFHDWGEHGTWRTVHGTTLKEAGFDRFEDNQPDNATTGEYCGSIFRSGLLNDVWCHVHLSFICEKDPLSLIDDRQ